MRLPLSRRLVVLLAVVGGLLVSLGPVAAVRAATPEGLAMEATAMLDGHARIGSWMAIDVHVRNDGPPIIGELRLDGGVQGKTRFGTPVDLPTQSEKSYRLYAQPPAFGRELTIDLIEGDSTIASTKAAFAVHEAQQLIIGVVAERPGEIVGGLDLLPNQNAVAPLVIGLTVADLPDRVEAWSAIDRLIWQDTDSTTLTTEQLEAMRGWIAGGGRLIIVGGTAGPSSLSAFSDDILPYRPEATTDVAPASLQGLLGELPDDAADLPALAGVAGGRTSPGRQRRPGRSPPSAPTAAAPSPIVGFDPTIGWLAESSAGEGLWRRLLPARSSGGPVVGDDSQIVSAASQLPTLALPPIGGLIALLGAYILLIGPINYLVLKRLDRREWAWVTMPALIVVFAVASYGIGSFLRGSEVIVNEVAIVRGAPGATEGTAQSTSASSRRAAGRTRSASRAGRSCRRRSAATSSAATRTRPASTSCRAIRPASATSASASARCARSEQSRRSASRSSRRTSSSSTVGSRAASPTSRTWSSSRPPSSLAAPSRSSTTSRRAPPARSTCSSPRSSSASSCRTRSSGR